MDRRLWTPQEDEHIVRLVAKFGTKKWPLISQRLCAETEFERTGKQCRQRWYNHLSPEINSADWSQQDEERLFEAHKEFGNKWKIISKLFEGRTDNSIKNHFYSTIRRCLRRINKLQGEKNSTLKMRTIKPYVLSKILADRNLTETILQLGKIKPNKSRKQHPSHYFQDFNQMINKLYKINHEYQALKNNKKQLLQQKMKGEAFNQSPSVSSSSEQQISPEVSTPKKDNKTRSNLVKQNEQFQQPFQLNLSPCKMENIKKSPKKESCLKRRNSRSKPELAVQLQQFKQIKMQENTGRRNRKTINYMKLNQGILCENQRQQIQDTCHDSEHTRKKVQFMSSQDLSLDERLYHDERLSDIMEVEEKSLEKDHIQNHLQDLSYNRPNLLGYDDLELKGTRHFQISHPSPSYNKSVNFFQDLVVIGTQLKIISTPRAPSKEHLRVHESQEEQIERKKSQQNFIEDILEIDFDPEFVMNYGQSGENQEKVEKQ